MEPLPSLTVGGDPALMFRKTTSITEQSAGSLSRLIGSSITGCDQSHLFLSSAQLSHTDKMEVNSAEHKNHQKDKVSICAVKRIVQQFSLTFYLILLLAPEWFSDHHALSHNAEQLR